MLLLCLTLCHPVDYGLPGSSIHGISQAKTPEWVAISFSKGSSCPRDQICNSPVGWWILYHWATREAQRGKLDNIKIQSVQFSCSVVFDSLRPHGLQHARLPCPSPTPRACLKLCPSSQWCHTTISSFVVPFPSCLQFFPASGSFQMSQFFTSGGQCIGASASVLPMNIQDWFPLGVTGWISLQSKGLSKVFSNTTVQKHQFFGTQPS